MTDAEFTVTLPSLGEDVTEATITRWLVEPGDTVDAETPLLEVATDKVDTEIPSPHAGTVAAILVAENDVVEVGAALATITTAPASQPDQEPEPVTAEHKPVTVETTAAPSASTAFGRPTDTDTHTDAPSISVATAQPAAAAPPAVTNGADTSVEKLPKIRQTIARRMMESLHGAAQLTTVVEADVTSISMLRTAHKAEFQKATGTKLSFLPFFAKATVEALAEHPVLSASVNTECTEITYHHSVNLGIAVDGPKGLIVPVIRHADRLSIAELAAGIAEVADHVRAGTISPDALTGGTFTITNTGSRGALFDTPILNRPESAILGTGSVVERVVPLRDPDGAVGFSVRSVMYLSITYDHRVVDGADAARFLTTVRQRLETGFTEKELLHGSHRPDVPATSGSA
ncbi:dihydrolipoamide acetyltransferase family protein [Mycobacterium sp.]|uniref:dihydrolipoamide acetyltransferase family protein n=1 Tax=Mycobacterium sp. TaxID=1785 RepID=UPI003D0F2DB2